MSNMNIAVSMDRFAAEVGSKRSDRFNHFAAEGIITAPAAAFARQVSAVALFLEALSVGNEAKSHNSL